MWQVHERGTPLAILRRAGLSETLWWTWKKELGASHPWLFEWLYHRRTLSPQDAGAEFTPTPAMHAFRRESRAKAILRAAHRTAHQVAAESQKHRRYGQQVSVRLAVTWLKRYRPQAWFRAWLLCGEAPPSNVTVATLGQIRFCRKAWDFTAHCRSARLVPTTSYCRWIGHRTLPDLGWLKWLFGDLEPDGIFVVSLALQALRRERLQDHVRAAAGIGKRPFYAWKRNRQLSRALGVIVAVVEQGKAPAGAQELDGLHTRTRNRMMAFARAGTLRECHRRSKTSPVVYYQALRKAEASGVRQDLQRYIEAPTPRHGPARHGLVTKTLFVPTPGMIAFRAAAIRARAHWPGLAELWRLQGIDKWFSDWTAPTAWRGRRKQLPGTGGETPARPSGQSGTESQNERGSTTDTRHAKPGGRPRGVTRAVADRVKRMLQAWDRGEFGNNKAAAGRAFSFNRPDASKIINAHEAAKRRKNPPS
jgi:hypothetical protein